jgi:hypothetical protein
VLALRWRKEAVIESMPDYDSDLATTRLLPAGLSPVEPQKIRGHTAYNLIRLAHECRGMLTEEPGGKPRAWQFGIPAMC